MGIDEKNHLRSRARAARDAMPPDARAAADAAIAARVAETTVFAEAPAVLSYAAMGSEVATRALIEAALERGKLVALPRVMPGTRLMSWHAIGSLAEVQPGYAGIPEPPDDPATLVDPASLDRTALALVPGLLFDAQGFRLGYGGGFYDTFLTTFPGRSLGLARENSIVHDLGELGACASFDRPVGLVATEGGLLTIL